MNLHLIPSTFNIIPKQIDLSVGAGLAQSWVYLPRHIQCVSCQPLSKAEPMTLQTGLPCWLQLKCCPWWPEALQSMYVWLPWEGHMPIDKGAPILNSTNTTGAQCKGSAFYKVLVCFWTGASTYHTYLLTNLQYSPFPSLLTSQHRGRVKRL